MIAIRNSEDCSDLFLKYGVSFSKDNPDRVFGCGALFIISQLACLSKYGCYLFDMSGRLNEKVCSSSDKDPVYGRAENYPSVSPEADNILRFVCDVFGQCSIDELRSILESLSFWDDGNSSLLSAGRFGTVSVEPSENDLFRIHECYNAYIENRAFEEKPLIFNGVRFYCYDIDVTDDLLKELESISLRASDKAYVVYLDNGKLVFV